MTDENPTAGRTVVSKAAGILMTYLNGEAHTLSEIAAATGLPLSTAHRLVRELAAWRILERTEDGGYCVGLPLRLIGASGRPGCSLEERAALILHDVSEALGAVGKTIEGKGVRVRLLRECEKGALIYVYRPAMLEKRLARGEVRSFLERRGYAGLTMDECIDALARHVHCGEEFPHEIGVFLDYPLEDVVGYI